MNSADIKQKNSGKIRLTVVSSYFYPKIGGLETIAHTTAKMLVEGGEYDVSVITSNYDGKGYKKEVVDGVVVHRLPVWFKFSNSPINPLWYFWIKKIFKEEKTNLVHTHSPVPFLVDIAVRVAKKMNIPTVVTYHSGSMKKNNIFLDPIISIYEQYFLRKLFKIANAVVTVHQAFMKNNYPEVAYKTSFIPTGVDLSRFKSSPLVSEPKVTFVGRIELSSMWKGINTLLESMVIVLKDIPGATLELVGGGDALEYYKNKAGTLGISKSVFIDGPKYGDNLVEVYEKTKVVVLPSTSDSEAFSVTLVEAMACGRPIIGTNIGGTPQVIEDGKNGLLVEPENVKDLASAILRVLKDQDFAQKLGDNGAERSKNFSWEIQVLKYDTLFKKILS